MLEPYRVSVVLDGANRTFTLHLPSSLAHKLKSSRTGGFMGRDWDGWSSPAAFQRWCKAWAEECLRVLKPGGHMLAFGGTRTVHRLVTGIEDAGFGIRDRTVNRMTGVELPPELHWCYGGGFPKSLDVSKAIDRAAGVEREAGVQRLAAIPADSGKMTYGRGKGNRLCGACGKWTFATDRCQCAKDGGPATDAARQWEGWGTALKPSYEPIVVARKPLEGTVAGNVLQWGTGALNVDGCRVEGHFESGWSKAPGKKSVGGILNVTDELRAAKPDNTQGRWPANLLLSHSADCEDRCAEDCPIALMDWQSGDGVSRASRGRNGADSAVATWGLRRDADETRGHNDTGGASRFFPQFRPDPFLYTAKAATSERPRAKREGAGNGRVTGLGGKVRQCNVCETRAIESGAKEPSCGHGDYRWEEPTNSAVGNIAHPTVKPLELMRWLVRLITPPGGIVLDPFAGSGTTGEAALLEGMQAVLIEREPDYLPLIVQRLTRQRDPVAHAKATGTEGEGLW